MVGGTPEKKEKITDEYHKQKKMLSDFWQKALFYHNLRNTSKKEQGLIEKDIKLEAMREIMEKKIPVVISVFREKDI